MKARRAVPVIAALVLAAGAAQGSTVVGLSVEDQARLSEMVVVGEIVAQRGVDHGKNGIETAVTLRVTDVLKGDVRIGQAVVFHTRGGQVGSEISEAVGEAVFQSGQTSLVFIERVGGRLYNLGLSMGAWDVLDDGAGSRTVVRALQDGLVVIGGEAVERGPIAFDEMAVRVGSTKGNPRFDNEMLREAHGQGR
jgi:hypothetical protein